MTEHNSAETPNTDGWKAFFNGQAIKADLLMVMLDKNGIESRAQWENGDWIEEEDFLMEPMDRIASVLVRDCDYDTAWNLFYADRQDEL